MDELQPNPLGCQKFESNVFRREKCKHCAHTWQFHRGAISEAVVQSFTASQRDSQAARAAAEASAKAKARATARERRRAHSAVEDQWLRGDVADLDHDDSFSDANSDGSGEFRMVDRGELGDLRPAEASSSTAVFRVVNLIDFSECNQPAHPRGQRDSLSASSPVTSPSGAWAAAAQMAPPIFSEAPPPMSSATHRASAASHSQPTGFSTPMRSKDDVLLEEIQYLRQMLADCNEEKRIQVAIVRDELVDKQRTIEALSRQPAPAGGALLSSAAAAAAAGCPAAQMEVSRTAVGHEEGWQMTPSRDARAFREQQMELERREQELRRSLLQLQQQEERLADQLLQSEAQGRSLRAELEASAKQRRELERSQLESHRKLAAREEELQKSRFRLAWWEAGEEALAATISETEVAKWERDFKQATQRSLARLADRRLILACSEAAAAATMAATESMLCKICFDASIACALLPCRHHAFCMPCCRRVESSREPVCPLCRTRVTGLFETFAG